MTPGEPASHAGRPVLTVDVEEWFHICGVGGPLAPSNWPSLPSRVTANTIDLLDLLDRCGVRATFFVVGHVAARYPSLVERVLQAGHEIGSHSHMHQRVYDLTPAAFARDLDQSVAALTACGVRHIAGFRAPEWSINQRSLWALDVLAQKGFRYDSSMAPMRVVGDPTYPQQIYRRQTAHGPITECPPSVTRRFGQQLPFGGGWGLRMSRPHEVVRQIEARASRGLPSILWVHPWEIDDDPPRVRLPWATSFAHYFRLSGFRSRLEAILRQLPFGPLGPLVGETTP